MHVEDRGECVHTPHSPILVWEPFHSGPHNSDLRSGIDFGSDVANASHDATELSER